MAVRVGLVGYGRIGRNHEAALRALDGLELVGVADPQAPAAPAWVPAIVAGWPELLEAAQPDVVIVATPSATHAEVVAGLRAAWSGRIVVEKPVATTAADAEATLALDVDVVYHAASAPEVSWAAAELERWAGVHGPVVSVSMAFADAYAADLDRATATLGDSWLDSGINALSVLARLVDPVAVVERRIVAGGCSTFEADVRYDTPAGGGVARILTTWAAVEPSKSTRLAFADGAVVILDHQAVLGRLEVEGRVVELVTSGSTAPRLVQHYAAAFTRLLLEGRRTFPVDVDRRLHRLLFEAP